MNTGKNLLVLFLIILWLPLVNGQGLMLESNGKQKNIPLGNYITAALDDGSKGDCEKCKGITYVGQLEFSDSNQLRIKPISKNVFQKDDGYILQQEEEFTAAEESVTITFDEIYFLQDLGENPKAKKKKTNRNVLGGVLVMAGLITAATALIVENKKDQNKLFAIASSEFGLGIIFLSIGNKKKFAMKSLDGEEKLWQIKNQ